MIHKSNNISCYRPKNNTLAVFYQFAIFCKILLQRKYFYQNKSDVTDNNTERHDAANFNELEIRKILSKNQKSFIFQNNNLRIFGF